MFIQTAEAVKSSGDFDDKVRYGAHTDYQGFTILRPDKSDWHIVVAVLRHSKIFGDSVVVSKYFIALQNNGYKSVFLSI